MRIEGHREPRPEEHQEDSGGEPQQRRHGLTRLHRCSLCEPVHGPADMVGALWNSASPPPPSSSGSIFVVELPDKTFIATLVLATRFRPLLVWIGVTAAFLVQTVVAVLLGGLLARLPRTPVEVFATIMFLIGGFLLLRGAADADKEELETEEEFSHKGAATAHGLKVIATSFMVLFLAEWGDLSQLLDRVAGHQVRRPRLGGGRRVRRAGRWSLASAP